MFLFKVEQIFMVSGRGLVLLPGAGHKAVSVGNAIKLIRPDASVVESKISGIVFNEAHHIFVALTKEDVPVGTEVWLTS